MELEPLIPEFTPSPRGGRRRTVDDRAALNDILYVLQTGIPWEDRGGLTRSDSFLRFLSGTSEAIMLPIGSQAASRSMPHL